mmetsp:Transcript_19248/g.29494  ORF Transcript_19248/g.29494 Transcript_19248/m.29494 type:complete len:241 (+) Transcript_19248:305-1027(+)
MSPPPAVGQRQAAPVAQGRRIPRKHELLRTPGHVGPGVPVPRRTRRLGRLDPRAGTRHGQPDRHRAHAPGERGDRRVRRRQGHPRALPLPATLPPLRRRTGRRPRGPLPDVGGHPVDVPVHGVGRPRAARRPRPGRVRAGDVARAPVRRPRAPPAAEGVPARGRRTSLLRGDGGRRYRPIGAGGGGRRPAARALRERLLGAGVPAEARRGSGRGHRPRGGPTEEGHVQDISAGAGRHLRL